MSLTIDISTTTERITRVVVINQGHPRTGEHPDHDDLRRYTWHSSDGHCGDLYHYRGRGAVTLASLVLDDYERQMAMAEVGR